MRIQFEISEKENAEIEMMMKETNVKTKRDLLNNAITLFSWAIGERKKGRIIASVDEKEDKYKEVIMSSLAYIGHA